MIFTDDQKLDNFLFTLLAGRVPNRGIDRMDLDGTNVRKHKPLGDPWEDKECINFILDIFGVSTRQKSRTYKRKRK
jgi:hypothetical protein